MRPLLVIEQDATLPGAGIAGAVADRLGVERVTARAWADDLARIDLGEYAGVIPLGGAMSVLDAERLPYLDAERLLLREAVERAVPVLGICLGGQLLASALGAAVRPNTRPEAGWLDVRPTAHAAGDALLGHLSAPTPVYQWHVDVFDIPAGAVRLATSELSPNQAFRHGDRSWGLQFHPEVDLATFDVWHANHPGACEPYDLDEAGLRAQVAIGSPTFTEGIFSAFFAVCAAAQLGALPSKQGSPSAIS